jgi:hypothetical protein
MMPIDPWRSSVFTAIDVTDVTDVTDVNGATDVTSGPAIARRVRRDA